MFSFPKKNQEILLIQILHFGKNAIRDIWLWVTLLALINVIVIVVSLLDFNDGRLTRAIITSVTLVHHSMSPECNITS